MRRRTLESGLLHTQHRGSQRKVTNGRQISLLDPRLSDGWSLIVCLNLFLRLNLHNNVDSILCPGRFGVLSWCNDILARLGLLHWCNLIVSQGILARPNLLVFVNTIYVTCIPFKMREMLLKRTLRIQNCRLLAKALVCCSAIQLVCCTIVRRNVRCGCMSAVCMLNVTSCSRRPHHGMPLIIHALHTEFVHTLAWKSEMLLKFAHASKETIRQF